MASRKDYTLRQVGKNQRAFPKSGGPSISRREYNRLAIDYRRGPTFQTDRAARVRLWRDNYHPEIKDLRKAVKGYNQAMLNVYKSHHDGSTVGSREAIYETYEGDFDDLYAGEDADDYDRYELLQA